jgi:hypothetical protein
MRRNAVAMGTILFFPKLLVRNNHLLSFIHDSVLNNSSAPTFSGELDEECAWMGKLLAADADGVPFLTMYLQNVK